MLTAVAAARCSKCDRINEELPCDDVDADAANSQYLCKNCNTDNTDTLIVSDATQVVAMEINTESGTTFRDHADLTTTETMASVDELEKEQAELEKALQEQCQNVAEKITIAPKLEPATSSSTINQEIASSMPTNAKPDAAADTIEKPAATSSHESTQATRTIAKITRSSINGARSPAMLKHLRKSTRSTRFKSKVTARSNAAGGNAANGHNGHNAGTAAHAMLGSGGNSKAHGKAGMGGAGNTARNRRTLFKRPAQKTPRVQATTKFVKHVFYKGSYMQLGDIVSIVDSDHNVYYAQIRGLLVDAYCEKSAFLTWLIPTQDSPDPNEGFDPATYLIGPDEELSRKLCYLEFVMHAPSNYYFDRTTPFPLPDADDYAAERAGGYIWTRMSSVKREKHESKP